ncbi:hypothetical protein NLG97_g3815 [Lecanicillium saksenae]|uniref:Uncharacterized protein n=1 Tax=Lecanicillium saksenae TaxID=468837 RepID=A0ACC1R0Z7_9HYPO|nr:hypothetical protein NLG97_g3815 [Lecanicillium saksenae]
MQPTVCLHTSGGEPFPSSLRSCLASAYRLPGSSTCHHPKILTNSIHLRAQSSPSPSPADSLFSSETRALVQGVAPPSGLSRSNDLFAFRVRAQSTSPAKPFNPATTCCHHRSRQTRPKMPALTISTDKNAAPTGAAAASAPAAATTAAQSRSASPAGGPPMSPHHTPPQRDAAPPAMRPRRNSSRRNHNSRRNSSHRGRPLRIRRSRRRRRCRSRPDPNQSTSTPTRTRSR